MAIGFALTRASPEPAPILSFARIAAPPPELAPELAPAIVEYVAEIPEADLLPPPPVDLLPEELAPPPELVELAPPPPDAERAALFAASPAVPAADVLPAILLDERGAPPDAPSPTPKPLLERDAIGVHVEAPNYAWWALGAVLLGWGAWEVYQRRRGGR